MAAHSSILAWEIPWTEESGGLQSMGLQRVGYRWATRHTFHVYNHTRDCLSLVHFLSEPLAQLWMRLWESVNCGVSIPSEAHTKSNFIHSDHCSVP